MYCNYKFSSMDGEEKTANKMKETAINQIKINDYEGAWNVLYKVKNSFPAYTKLDHMLFVCDVLKSVDVTKPGEGVNWLQILRLPLSAPTSAIRSYFMVIIDWLEAIKSDFPGTNEVQEILTAAMQDFCEHENDKQTKFQLSTLKIYNANDGSSRKRARAEISSRRRITRSVSSAQQSEILGNSGNVAKNATSGRRFHLVGDHYKLPEFGDVLVRIPKILNSCPQARELAEIIDVDEIDEVSIRYEPNKGNCENRLVKDDRLAIKTPGTWNTERNTGIHSSPEMKVLFDTMPQSPHYNSLTDFGEKFRSCMIIGIEQGFMVLAEQISGFADAEDVKCKVNNIKKELLYLETMGFDVQRMKTRLEKLYHLAEQKKQAPFEAYQVELEGWKAQRETFETKYSVLHHLVVGLKDEIQRTEEKMAFYQSAINVQKSKEAEVELKIDKEKEESRLFNLEIERTAKLAW